MRSWDAMLADKAIAAEIVPLDPPDEDHWFDFTQWIHYYWLPTRGWTMKLSLWWHYNVRRYPKPPPLEFDPVYQRLFVPRKVEEGET